MTNWNTNLAWQYHEATKHTFWSIRTNPHFLDWDNQPLPFKIYPEIPPMPLPRELKPAGIPALEALDGVLGKREREAASIDSLAALLFYAAGITKKKTYPDSEVFFRAAPCAGALYPIEVYVVCADIEGLGAGVYHFGPGDFALRRLRAGDFRGVLLHATGERATVGSAPVILVFTAMSWRSAWKYLARSYRYHFWDNGAIVANALAMAAGQGIEAEVIMGFVDAEINRLLGIDGRRELALSLVPLEYDSRGHSRVTPHPAEEVPEIDYSVIALSPSELDYPAIHEMHDASSLSTADEVREWRSAAEQGTESTASFAALESALPASALDRPLEDVIVRRASTRRFARKPIPLSDLSTILDRLIGGTRSDFSRSRAEQINEIYAIVNRIDGIQPGAYWFDRRNRSLALLKPGEFSDDAARLVLDQELGGDASAVFFLMADLTSALSRFGNRGYRVCQMEAGIISGRIYLAAYALGRGATGLTFYDDDVTQFFSPRAAGKSCMIATAIGVAGKQLLF